MAIGLDGTEKSVEKWKNEDILELLEVLNDKRADLYGVLEQHFSTKAEGSNDLSDMCGEPLVGELNGKYRSKKVVSFNSILSEAQLEVLVGLVNELHIFSKPKNVTVEVLAAFFRCEETELQVCNLRLFCAMMTSLANHVFINQYWQAPIYRNRLLLAPQKKVYVNRCDLAFANHAINYVVMDYRIERINHIVRSLFDIVKQKD